MYEKPKKKNDYQIINMIYVLRVYCTLNTHGVVLRSSPHCTEIQNVGKQNMNWTVYVCALIWLEVLEVCALFVECYFGTWKTNSPNSFWCWKNFQKCSIGMELFNILDARHVIRHTRKCTITHSLTNIYSITHIHKSLALAHTRSLKTALTCAAMCDVWSDLILFSAFFLLLLLVLLLFCIDFEILLCHFIIPWTAFSLSLFRCCLFLFSCN